MEPPRTYEDPTTAQGEPLETDPKFTTDSFHPIAVLEAPRGGRTHREVLSVNPALGLQNRALYDVGRGVGFVTKQNYKSSRTELLENLGYHQVQAA